MSTARIPRVPTVPHSRARLSGELASLGVERGSVLMVHASLRAVGAVDGGADAVAAALRDALGPEGTLVVPAFTPENSDTSALYHARVRGLGEQEREAVRAAMPAFDPATTAAPSMGRLSEAVRLTHGAARSAHPQTSFAALGPLAGHVLADHHPDCHLGEDSPLARLHELRAGILLLGTGFGSCTAFHLAEYRVPSPPRRTYRCVVRDGGRRRWWEYEDVALDDSDFTALGADFERSDHGTAVRTAAVGSATGRLFRFPAAVAFAVGWLPSHRRGAVASEPCTPAT
ncbi:aminoglycoside N(3)-acetyltransferase [Streptomyces sp. NBC_01022]|uniref:aminoglycoside N(3)-acetyltransferase n=1 Tax=Streptomyces sp. NBC_01022 TaxID=2903723 RepID=UPI002DD8A0B3|nr:AAC(3) family N-acetyltransferase [Streptomyces sp. NBC_01022]WRZ80373.1 AAC(3) family N-acetyltransferase [Streptomyces sp. NBC_01022]